MSILICLFTTKKSASQLKYFSLSDFSFSLFSLTQNRNENIENCTQITAAKSCHKSFRLKSSVFFLCIYFLLASFAHQSRENVWTKKPQIRVMRRKIKIVILTSPEGIFLLIGNCIHARTVFIKIHLVYYKYCSHGDN